MKKIFWTVWIASVIISTSCGESSKPYSEIEKKTQDSLDALQQDAAFDDLMNEDSENDTQIEP